jgi:hypothetical protein
MLRKVDMLLIGSPVPMTPEKVEGTKIGSSNL